MPEFNSTEYADQVGPYTKKFRPDVLGGRIRYAEANFTAPAGDLAANDTVVLTTLPVGAKVISHMSRFKCDLLGAARTLDVGFKAHTNEKTGAAVAADADAFVDGADASAAVDQLFSAATVGGNDPDHVFDGEAQVYMTVLGGTMPATKTCKVQIAYVVD